MSLYKYKERKNTIRGMANKLSHNNNNIILIRDGISICTRV